MSLDRLIEAAQHPNVQAFLRVIRQGETDQTDDAYRMMFGGALFDAPPWVHPRQLNAVNTLKSTAAGAYQFLARTWDAIAAQYGIPDFSPPNQDLAAIGLIAGRRALDHVIAGRINEAIRFCGAEWASLPGSPYGQPTQSLDKARAVFAAYGGSSSPPPESVPTPAPAKEVSPMGPWILPILQGLASFIPQIGGLFANSEVAKRNVAAGTILADTLVKATGAMNLQDAAEKIQNDPGALQAAKQAVSDVWPSITEAGGGGMKSARDAVVSAANVPLHRDRTFIIALLFYPLVAAVVLAALLKFPWLADMSVETRAMVVGFVMGTVAGAILAFFFGTTSDSQKKTDMIAAR